MGQLHELQSTWNYMDWTPSSKANTYESISWYPQAAAREVTSSALPPSKKHLKSTLKIDQMMLHSVMGHTTAVIYNYSTIFLGGSHLVLSFDSVMGHTTVVIYNYCTILEGDSNLDLTFDLLVTWSSSAILGKVVNNIFSRIMCWRPDEHLMQTI